MSAKRLRMFAGPNGSGKSTIKHQIELMVPGLFDNYINPDEIEIEIRKNGSLNFGSYGIDPKPKEVLDFFIRSPFLNQVGLAVAADQLIYKNGALLFQQGMINSYYASVSADFIRQSLLVKGESFSFETVMSSPDKVEFLCKARDMGYRTYLYYVATDDPLINISRVLQRSQKGGHSVPEDKTIARYERSLGLLMQAISCSDRAYIFDNSSHSPAWIAEITGGKVLDLKMDDIPGWFKKVLGDNVDLG